VLIPVIHNPKFKAARLPEFKFETSNAAHHLLIGAWDLSGAWSLRFGAFFFAAFLTCG
jgi:hypothetical protein